MLTITPIYASLLGLIFIYLSALTIKQRRKQQVAIGDGQCEALARAMRVHANFAEYVPLALILFITLELNQAHGLVIHLLCLMLLIGRISHAYGVKDENENLRYRIVGMILTFTAMALAALANIATIII